MARNPKDLGHPTLWIIFQDSQWLLAAFQSSSRGHHLFLCLILRRLDYIYNFLNKRDYIKIEKHLYIESYTPNMGFTTYKRI